MSRQLTFVIVVVYLVSTTAAFAGTFRDDFENEQDFLNDKQLREGGVWEEDIAFFTWENGAIKGRNDLAIKAGLITGDYWWEDYTVEFRAKLITDLDFDFDGIGLVLRRPCIGCDGDYFFFFGRSPGGGNTVALMGKDPQQPLKTAPFQISKDVWYTFKVAAQGEQLEFYVDNKLVLEARDNAFPTGKAGFVVQNGGGGPLEALFDDFVVTGPEVEDGGHWDPEAHSVESKGKLATMWATLKQEL